MAHRERWQPRGAPLALWVAGTGVLPLDPAGWTALRRENVPVHSPLRTGVSTERGGKDAVAARCVAYLRRGVRREETIDYLVVTITGAIGRRSGAFGDCRLRYSRVLSSLPVLVVVGVILRTEGPGYCHRLD
eukprot:scaffold2842_cov373-Prasinococcus_capsulatus_cf.AAC.4